MAPRTQFIKLLQGHENLPFQLVLNESENTLFSSSCAEIITWSMSSFSIQKRVQVQSIYKIIPIGDTLLAVAIKRNGIMDLVHDKKTNNDYENNVGNKKVHAVESSQHHSDSAQPHRNDQRKQTKSTMSKNRIRSINFLYQKDLTVLFQKQSKLLTKADDLYFLTQPKTLIIQRQTKFVFYPLSRFFAMIEQNELSTCALNTLFYSLKDDLFYIMKGRPTGRLLLFPKKFKHLINKRASL